jgi:hypothetical protein
MSSLLFLMVVFGDISIAQRYAMLYCTTDASAQDRRAIQKLEDQYAAAFDKSDCEVRQ